MKKSSVKTLLIVVVVIFVVLLLVFLGSGTSQIQPTSQENEIAFSSLSTDVIKIKKTTDEIRTVIESINSRLNVLLILMIISIGMMGLNIALLLFRKRPYKQAIHQEGSKEKSEERK